ncbi:MAG TPA: hypothetical protein VNT29_05505, partial [Candidatus Limnocylindrales bacterium]|nr:hypothetical protein [Candidatus Limnocylindrales bacterium]
MNIAEFLNADFDDKVEIEMDASGHYRVIFSEEELKEVNAYLKAELDRTYDDWIPLWNRSVDNKETYRTRKIPIPDGGTSVYPAPIARIPADQVIASIHNAIMRPRPVFSIDAYLKAEYDVPGQQVAMPLDPNAPPGAPPPNVVTAEKQTAELVAHRMEQGYDFVVRERIKIASKLMRGVKGAVCGHPYWWKVVADPDEKTSLTAKSNGIFIDLDDKYEETSLRGDIVKWYLVPFTNGMMPLEYLYDEDGMDLAPWFAERKPMRPDELAKQYAAGNLFLIPDDAAALRLASSTVDRSDEFKARGDQTTKKTSSSAPVQDIPRWEVWFYWTANYIDPMDPTDDKGKKKWKVKRVSLIGDFHLGAGELMTCKLNSYEHRSRPFELVDQMDEGDCTVDRMMYHQTMFTYSAQSEIRSSHIANTPLYWHDPNIPDLVTFFASHKTISAGDHIPGIKDKEWGLTPAGEKHYSQLELMKFFLSMSQLDSRENDFTMGGRPPGRTPAATTAQVYQHAEEVKTMFLARLSVKLSRLLRLDAETRRQYQPLGETLPIWDAEHKTTIEIPFRFPVGDVLDNFRIALTAADEALSEEKDPQQIMMRKQALMADGEYVAKIMAAIVNLSQPLPAEGVAVFVKIIERDQAMMRKLMAQTVTDEENYDLTADIETLVAARNAALQKLQSQPPPPPQAPPPQV